MPLFFVIIIGFYCYWLCFQFVSIISMCTYIQFFLETWNSQVTIFELQVQVAYYVVIKRVTNSQILSMLIFFSYFFGWFFTDNFFLGNISFFTPFFETFLALIFPSYKFGIRQKFWVYKISSSISSFELLNLNVFVHISY